MRLNGLAMMQYNHHIPFEADEVIEEFDIRHPKLRKLAFAVIDL